MKKSSCKVLFIGLIVILFSSETLAQLNNKFYVGGGAVWGRYANGSGATKYVDATYGFLFKAGYKWNQYVGVEGKMLGTLFAEDPLGGQTFRHFGLFVKPSMPLYETMNVYALIGLALTKTVTGGNHSLLKVNESGFSTGVGMEYDISKYLYNSSVFLEYQRLLIASDTPNMDSVGVGVSFHF